MKNLIVIISIVCFSNSFTSEPPMDIITKGISIVPHNTYMGLSDNFFISDDYILSGELIFRNNTNKTIEVPKHIVLYFNLTDDKGNNVPLRTDIHFDNPLWLIFPKSFKIPASEDYSRSFADIRLNEFNLKKGEKYYLQYFLYVDDYKKLKRQLKVDYILSNIVEFEW